MPVQGWMLTDSSTSNNSDTTVVVAPFEGVANTFHADGPLDSDHAWQEWKKLPHFELADEVSDSKVEHVARVARAVSEIRSKSMRKAVIARREDLSLQLEVESTFNKLEGAYPNAVIYALNVDGVVWMGATPETLLTSDEHALYTMALAGTRRPDGPAFTDKEYDEQLAVTESIHDVLLRLGSNKIDARGPEPITAGPVEHLITRIEAGIPVSGNPSTWAESLHPTPAVCGMPKAEAKNVIASLENFNRELYAGYIGWWSSESSRFYVNLRCMQVGQKRVALYAGGGITAMSDPESEWDETVVKLTTLKNVITQDK